MRNMHLYTDDGSAVISQNLTVTGDIAAQDLMGGTTANNLYVGITARCTLDAVDARNSALSCVSNTAGSETITVWNKTTAGYTGLIDFSIGTTRTQVGHISSNGTSISYNTTSDGRLKEIMPGEVQGLSTIRQLQLHRYRWKSTGAEDEGLIAQEVATVMPKAVSGSEDRTFMLDYSTFVVPLIKAVQEQQAMIEALTTRIAALETKKTTKKTM